MTKIFNDFPWQRKVRMEFEYNFRLLTISGRVRLNYSVKPSEIEHPGTSQNVHLERCLFFMILCKAVENIGAEKKC